MVDTKGEPVQIKTLRGIKDEQKNKCIKILKIFGTSGADSDGSADLQLEPTRVSFADCPMNADWKAMARQNRWDLFEVKSENSINRIEGTARNPRFTERVVEGAQFDFSATLKLLGENEEDLFEYLLDGLKLLEMDALGGSGSRGYGRIEFQFDDEALNEKFKDRKPFSNGGK